MSLPDTPFQVLLQQAAALKTSRQAPFRKKYDSYPTWYRNSLFSQTDLINVRNSKDFKRIIQFSFDCKQKGNDFYQKHEYSEAIYQYERALGVFHWLESLDEDWNRKEIDDERLVEKVYLPTNSQESHTIYELQINCYLNLSVCYLRTNEWTNCVIACDSVLSLSPSQSSPTSEQLSKAYYRRAQARYLPPSCGTVDNQQALKDLKSALKLTPADRNVRSLLAEVKESLQRQIQTDKQTFSNLFERTDVGIYSSTPVDNSEVTDKERVLTFEDAQWQLRDMETAAAQYKTDGRYIDYQHLKARIVSVKGELESYRSKQVRQKTVASLSRYDFSKPSAEMVAEAAQKGIDLANPGIQRLLTEMNENQLKKFQESSTDVVIEDDKEDIASSALRSAARKDAFEAAKILLQGIEDHPMLLRDMWRHRMEYSGEKSAAEDGNCLKDLVLLLVTEDMYEVLSCSSYEVSNSTLLLEEKLPHLFRSRYGSDEILSLDISDKSKRSRHRPKFGFIEYPTSLIMGVFAFFAFLIVQLYFQKDLFFS